MQNKFECIQREEFLPNISNIYFAFITPELKYNNFHVVLSEKLTIKFDASLKRCGIINPIQSIS